MCQKLNCFISACLCCSECKCEYTCYDCYEIKYERYNVTDSEFPIGDDRSYTKSADVRHKFVCFPCRRVWKSYTNKYLVRIGNNPKYNFSEYVPNICKPNMTLEEQRIVRSNYFNSRGRTSFGGDFSNLKNKPKCSKCGQNGICVGRNFRPCKNEKLWKQMEDNVKNGKIDLQTDFRNYPKKEGREFYGNVIKRRKIKQIN